MPKGTVQVFGDGRVTIPKGVRKALRIEDGDLVEIDVSIVERGDADGDPDTAGAASVEEEEAVASGCSG